MATQNVVGLGLGLGGGARPAPNAATPAPATPAVAAKPKARVGIEIKESAAERIRKLLADRGTPDAALRIRVKGGGCSGLAYDMEFADAPKEKDRVFEAHGVKVFVDPKSYIFLVGTVLEYHTGLLESGFKLHNPNVAKSCSCGESFTV
jgi:iron-sulfur cluster assembly protein